VAVAEPRELQGEFPVTNSTTKSAIITGASGGIGGSIAKRLAKDGFAVVVNYAGKAAPAQSLVADIKAAGGQGIAAQADVAIAADVERLFKESMEAFGRPDVVVHCAGIMALFPIASGDVATFDKVIATNLRGTFLVLAQAAQHVPDGGRIMAFSSSVLAKSFPTYGAYIASKAGVEGMVHVLANELRGRNITVNAVAPGQVRTDLFMKGKSDALIDELTKMNPLERLGMPEDMANLVSFLAGPEGGWINSQVLLANGGFAY
jgi:3-oxoacyl-[acyl-carrier protein] reductase